MIDKEFYEDIQRLLDKEAFEQARGIVTGAIKNLPKSTVTTFPFELKLHCLLNDIGNGSHNKNDLETSINFFESNADQIQSLITTSSYYYNLANAKHGLSEIHLLNNRGVPSTEIIKKILQAPINLYWLAYKNNEKKSNNGLQEQILINLSNSLNDSGRLIEGLQFLDIVLRRIPEFPQALISRGDNLYYLSKVTNCAVTISLFVQIYKSYDNGIRTNVLPPFHLQRSIQHREEALELIKSYGGSIDNLNKEILETEKEFNNLKEFRKFCINNFLTLNEHAIYCNCIAAEKDDLQIGVRNARFKGKIVPKLEILLNRIKSEFSLARWLFYQPQANNNQVDFDTRYSELLDGEIINAETEMLRSSFRICYGILDKIALGICKLYNLDSNKIYFESFWENKTSWEKINQTKNMHLSALYSIAMDLNTTTGELKHFKTWRNKLEHNILILKDTKKEEIDTLKIYEDKDFIEVADINDFKDKTLHLLQLTRAAIFSFVFCVRLQTIERLDGDESKSFIVDFKK